MEIVQSYETTVADKTNGYELRFLVIAQKSLSLSVRHNEAAMKAALESTLGLQGTRSISASALPQAIVGMLRADEEEVEFQELQANALLDHLLSASPPAPVTTTDTKLLEFAEHVAFSPLVPFEESPLGLVSLASKAAALSKNGVALGAFIGVIAGGATPLLLLTVPAGIILCATAVAYAKVVDAKRSDIFISLMGFEAGSRGEMPPAVQVDAILPERGASTTGRKRPQRR